MKQCQSCPADVYAPRAKYCRDCLAARRAKSNRDGLLRGRHSGLCEDCGAPHGRAASARRCVPCAAKHNKARAAATSAAWARAHPERQRAFVRAHRDRDPEKHRAQARDRYQRDVGRNRARKRRWREENREKAEAIRARWDAIPENREKARTSTRNWQKRNPEYARLAAHRRRVAIRAADDGFTRQRWRDLVASYDGRCAYCFAPSATLEIDHVVAITRGGRHSADNIAPACRSCNGSKHNKDVHVWLGVRKCA